MIKMTYEIRYSATAGVFTVGRTWNGDDWEPVSDHISAHDAQAELEQLQNPEQWRHIRDLSNRVSELENRIAELEEDIERAGLLRSA